MEKGFYLYCIKENTGSKFSTEGIGGGQVYTIAYQDLETVVSEVSLEEFDSEEIQKKSQEDVGWIKEKAQNHQKVIEEAMGMGSVIPMQFGVVFKTKENLEETLSKHFDQFKQSLEKLTGKQEWGLKVFLKGNIFREAIEKKNEQVLAKKKEIEAMPKGMAFFAQKQIDKVIDEEKDKELDKIIEDIDENLGQLSFSKNKAKLLEKDFTGIEEEMILNSFYLIEELKLNQFQKKVEELKEKHNSRGIIIEMTGPWPPYHFA